MNKILKIMRQNQTEIDKAMNDLIQFGTMVIHTSEDGKMTRINPLKKNKTMKLTALLLLLSVCALGQTLKPEDKYDTLKCIIVLSDTVKTDSTIAKCIRGYVVNKTSKYKISNPSGDYVLVPKVIGYLNNRKKPIKKSLVWMHKEL